MSDAQERARVVITRKREDSASMLRSRRAETLLTDLAAAGLSIVDTTELGRLRKVTDIMLDAAAGDAPTYQNADTCQVWDHSEGPVHHG